MALGSRTLSLFSRSRNSLQTKRLEVWADSFKEGEWAVESLLAGRFPVQDRQFIYNFQPWYLLRDPVSGVGLDVSVFGDYLAWGDRPDVVSALISVGKPDVVFLDAEDGRILLALEETNAVPTGNQACQRLERVWWAAESRIPFVYLLGEWGMHLDGLVRRSSIWPSYLALKLSLQYQIPSLTALYGSRDHPDDYAVGAGLTFTAKLAQFCVERWLGLETADREAELALLTAGFADMGRFIHSHADEIAPRLPAKDELVSDDFIRRLAARVAS